MTAFARELYMKLKSSHQLLAEFLMRDDPDNNFTSPSLEKKLTHSIPPFHKEIYSMMDDTTQQFTVLGAPRGFGKSVLCSISMPLKAALFSEHNDILLTSATESLSIEWLFQIRRHLEQNERILRYFGEQKSDKWTQSELILKNGVTIRAKGMGAQIRGFHPTLIIADDIENDEAVQTEEQRSKVKDWFHRVLINALALDGRLFMIGTYLHPLCFIKELIENGSDQWRKRCWQAYIDGIEQPGKELWPEVWPHKRLNQRKSLIGTWAFNAEFMNKPVPPDERKFNTELIPIIPKLPENTDFTFYMTTDPATSDSETADFKAAVTAATDNKNNLYLVSLINTRKPTSYYIQKIISEYRVYNHRKIGMEEVAAQKLFTDELNRVAITQGIHLPITTLKLNTRIKKAYRIEALEPRINNRSLILVGTPEYWQTLIQQLSDYHGEGSLRYDDALDCTASLLEIIEPTYDDTKLDNLNENTYPYEGWDDPDFVMHGTTGYGEEYELHKMRYTTPDGY